MMRQARDIEAEEPGSVVFLDFGDRDFDTPQTIEPTSPGRQFWKNAHSVALGDLAELVAPSRVVICEGEPATNQSARNCSLDADCYTQICENEFPETEFVSVGNDQQVVGDKRGLAETLQKLIGAMMVVRLIDRDDQTTEEVAASQQDGVRVLSRRNLESYLFDDEVLKALAVEEGKAEKVQELLDEKQRILDEATGRPADDLKPARGAIYVACKRILSLTQCGNTAEAFMRHTLAPLIKPGMNVYNELKTDIFETHTSP